MNISMEYTYIYIALWVPGHPVTVCRPVTMVYSCTYHNYGHYPSSSLIFKHNVSETELYLRLQVQSTQMGLFDRATLCLRRPTPNKRYKANTLFGIGAGARRQGPALLIGPN
jgi:hypothetical protein